MEKILCVICKTEIKMKPNRIIAPNELFLCKKCVDDFVLDDTLLTPQQE